MARNFESQRIVALVGLLLASGLTAAGLAVPLAAQNESAAGSAAASATSTTATSTGAGKATDAGAMPTVPEPKQVGGEPQSVVQVANLIYAGVKSSHCFSDHFL